MRAPALVVPRVRMVGQPAVQASVIKVVRRRALLARLLVLIKVVRRLVVRAPIRAVRVLARAVRLLMQRVRVQPARLEVWQVVVPLIRVLRAPIRLA